MTQKNKLLQSDLERLVQELGRERHNAEQCQMQLTAQTAIHKQLVDLFKTSQTNIVKDLTKEGSVLMNLLDSEGTTRAK